MSFGSRSLPDPTRFESQRIALCKDYGCVICDQLTRAIALPVAEYNHVKVGNLRVGHRYGYPLCPWHHRRVGFGSEPTLMSSYQFHRIWGSDQDLQNYIDDKLGIPRETIPARYRSGKATATPFKVIRNPLRDAP